MNIISRYLTDIRLWIVVLFLIRLEQINLPPLDAHAYRQALTLGVARNFVEWDANIFHPKTILCGSNNGEEIMEFPLLNYAVSLLWGVFGQQNWCFRLLGILVASWGLWHFFLIARRITGERAAKAATLFLGVSICFVYARKAMPDVFSLSLVIAGVSYGWKYLENGGWKHLLSFVLLCSAGILSKIPAAAAGTLIFYPLLLDPAVPRQRKIKLIGAGALAMLPVIGWYFVWIPYAEKIYAHNFYFRLGWAQAWAQLFTANDFSLFYTQEKFTVVALQCKICFFAAMAGLAISMDRNHKLLILILLYSLVFFYFMLQVGAVFSGHEYYVIPYVPIMALSAGFGLDQLFTQNRLFYIMLACIAIFVVYKKKSDFFIEYRDQRFVHLRETVDRYVPQDQRIVTVCDATIVPTMMYATGRKGRGEENAKQVSNPEWMKKEAPGIHYIIIDRRKEGEMLPYTLVYEDNEFRIFRMTNDE